MPDKPRPLDAIARDVERLSDTFETPVPWEEHPTAVKREVEGRGHRYRTPPESASVAPSKPPPSLRERARESPMGTAALVAALLAAAPGLIAAFRSPTDPELKAKVDVLDAERVRRAVEAPGKEAVEEALAEKRRKELDGIKAKIRDLEARCPAEVVMPDRAPR